MAGYAYDTTTYRIDIPNNFKKSENNDYWQSEDEKVSANILIYTEDNTNFPFEASCLIGYKARYTFHEFLNCKEGDTLSIYTNVNDGGPYVVDVNFYNDPSVFSKTLENPTGAFLKEICIPKSGTYRFVFV